MHLTYSIFTWCWIFVLFFHYVLWDGESICILEIQYHFISVFFAPNSAKCKKLTFAGFTFSFCFVVLCFITQRCRMFCTSINLWIIVVILNPFTSSLLQLSPLNCWSSCLICFMGFAINWYIFPLLSLNNFYYAFFLCAIASFSRGLNKDSLCASVVTYL